MTDYYEVVISITLCRYANIRSYPFIPKTKRRLVNLNDSRIEGLLNILSFEARSSAKANGTSDKIWTLSVHV